MAKKNKISYIVPVKDEEDSVEILIEQIIKNTKIITPNFEIIFVDDGSVDQTYKRLSELRKKNKKIKIIKHKRNFGKSKALMTGIKSATGDIVITLDGDLQDDPREIPRFIKNVNKGYDLVAGWKKKRKDSFIFTYPSKMGNHFISLLTGVKLHDLNCGFKAYKREAVKSLNLYGELYRFIPILLNQQGYKITEIPIKHKKRKYGKSKYSFFKLFKVALDLVTILFLTGYSSRPGHFFGILGIIFFIPGFLIGLYITYLRIATGGIDYRYPLMFLGVLLMIVGVQFVSTGLLAEMMIYLKKQNDN